MAKRKITVTVDEEVVDQARLLGDSHLSTVVNAALAEHVDRMARQSALRELLDNWNEQYGPTSDEDRAHAHDAFDELDGHTVRREIA